MKQAAPRKECPDCHKWVLVGYLTCPECKHVFKKTEKKERDKKYKQSKRKGIMTRKQKQDLNAVYLGIDPGVKGGAAVVSPNGIPLDTIKFEPSTEKDISNFFKEWAQRKGMLCVLEVAQYMAKGGKKQGAKSAFTSGKGYGFLRGQLHAHDIRFIDCRPQKWQTALGCLTGGDKKITKAKAQQLFPQIEIVHAIADALLLAWYVRQYWED